MFLLIAAWYKNLMDRSVNPKPLFTSKALKTRKNDLREKKS